MSIVCGTFAFGECVILPSFDDRYLQAFVCCYLFFLFSCYNFIVGFLASFNCTSHPYSYARYRPLYRLISTALDWGVAEMQFILRILLLRWLFLSISLHITPNDGAFVYRKLYEIYVENIQSVPLCRLFSVYLAKCASFEWFSRGFVYSIGHVSLCFGRQSVSWLIIITI